MAIGVQKSEQKIESKFIVVYDKFTERIANSLKNEAIEKGITATIWSEKQHEDNLPRLTNENYVLFLSKKKIENHLANPKLRPHTIIDGVEYKKHGHELGIYLSGIDFVEIAKRVGISLKEDWRKTVACLLQPHGIGLIYYYFSEVSRAKLYLLFRAADEFSKENLKKYVSDELDV